jgi:tetratricopeptide (TPR) repeat protein
LDGDSASQSDILSAAAWQDPSRRLPLVSEPSIKEAPLFTQGELPLTALAALAAGAKPDKLPELVEQIRHRLDQIRKALPPGAEPTRGNYFRLLTQMHRQIFYGGYDRQATDPRTTLSTGKYNCVSAAVLLFDLCQELGWECWGTEWPEHIGCCLRLEGGLWEAEPTVAPYQWVTVPPLRPASFTDLDSPLGSGNCSGVPELNPFPQLQPRGNGKSDHLSGHPPRLLDSRQLLAVVFFNRALELLAENRYEEALSAQLSSVKLDPANTQAKSNLIAILNNWAVKLARAQRYAEAVTLLDLAQSLCPDCHPVSENLRQLRALGWAPQ